MTAKPLKIEAVQGARAFVESGVVDYVRQWLANTTILEAAEVLGVSESTIKAIRAHLRIRQGEDERR